MLFTDRSSASFYVKKIYYVGPSPILHRLRQALSMEANAYEMLTRGVLGAAPDKKKDDTEVE